MPYVKHDGWQLRSPLYIPISKEWLIEQYSKLGYGANSIAKQKGVNVKLVLRRLREFNIKIRTLSEQKRLDGIRIGTWKGSGNPMVDIEIKRRAISNRGSVAGKNNPRWGAKLTDETKEKIRRKAIGRKTSEKTKQKIREAISGEKHYNWKGGISFQPYSFEWTNELKTAIRQRDKFTCAVCGKNGFTVHHIDYNKKNCDPANLITLCRSCHSKTNGDRTFWGNYFLSK